MARDAPPLHLTATGRHDISDVRHRVRDVADAMSSDAAWRDAVVLVTSEVVTNAIEYGAGGAVDVDVSASDDRLTVAVTADSTGIPLPPPAPVPPTDVRGRGLQVVHALADHVLIDVHGGRVSVICTFDRPR